MIWLVIFILGLSGIDCRSGIKPETSNHYKKLETLAESAVLTLLSCYEQKVDTVGGIGITEPNLVDILLTKQPLPVKLFREVDLEVYVGQQVKSTAPHKLHLFVIDVAANNDRQLTRNLLKALISQASAHLATFLIIDWPSEKNQKGCSAPASYLESVWFWAILNAFYVCVDKLEERVLVYTFNPYTSQAPEPWILNATINRRLQDHPWSLFVREYHPGNQEICNNLDFVKTHDLGGMKIRCVHNTNLPFSQLTAQHDKKVRSSNTVSSTILKYALKAVNATFDLYLMGKYRNVHLARNFKDNKTEILTPYDVDIFTRFITSINAINMKTSVPVMNMDYVVITHHTGEKTQLEKLVGVFDKTTRLCICLVIIGTLLFFKFFMRQPLGTATMNVIRIVGNTGLLSVPNGNAPRLFLAGVFILVVTIIGVYQGLLAALLTKPTPLPDIDTLDDLANSPHRIYVPSLVFAQFFTDPKFNGRLAHVKGICEINDNGDLIIRPMDACLQHRNNLIFIAIEDNLHISRETVVPAYAAYRIRNNWPLEERFNEIVASLVETRIFWHHYEEELKQEIKVAEYHANLEKERPKTMVLSNLGFAFAFLGIGLSFATIVLVIEIAMKRRELGQRKKGQVLRAPS